MKVSIDPNLCTGCGVCTSACTCGAIHLHEQLAFIDPTKCTSCGVCLDSCPTGALHAKVEGEFVTEIPGEKEMMQHQPATVATPPKWISTGAILLAVTGRYVLPRVMDRLVSFLERRNTAPFRAYSPTGQTTTIASFRPRRRRNRGRMASQIPEERR